MTPEPRAVRLSARHPSPELPMQGIGGEPGGGRAAITGGGAARFEVPAGRNLVEAG